MDQISHRLVTNVKYFSFWEKSLDIRETYFYIKVQYRVEIRKFKTVYDLFHLQVLHDMKGTHSIK
jgi:capsule polysaccharide modification protein KpsS